MRLHCQVMPLNHEEALHLIQELRRLKCTPIFDGEEVALDYLCDGSIDGQAQDIMAVFERYGCDRLIVYDSGGTAGEAGGSDSDIGNNEELKGSEEDDPSSQSASCKNIHHLLYQRRHWSDGGEWAKRLRGHAYMRVGIPRDTLHRKIHQKIHDIPVPSEDICERTWRELERLKQGRFIDCRTDRADTRLGVLMEMLRKYDDNLEATIAVLKWQQQVIQKFYAKSPQ